MQRPQEGLRLTTCSSVFASLVPRCSAAVLGLIILAGIAPIANAAVSMRVIADRTPLDTTPVQVYVSVNNIGGSPVSGLIQSNFQLNEDGSAQAISGFALPPISGPSAISVVFAMDYSNSVSPSSITAMENAVASFITTQMNVDDFGAVIKFDENVNLITPPGFTSIKIDLEAAARSVHTQTPATGTRIYDTISTALTQLAAASLPSGPRAIILLTDGDDNRSTNTLNSTLSQLSGSGVPVFTIAFGSSPNNTVLNSIASQSAGIAYQAASSGDLQGIYQAIAVRLRNEYLLTYSTAITDCNLHTLSVLVNNETQSVSFRRCTPPPAAPAATSSGGGGGSMNPLEWLMLLAFAAVYRKVTSDRQSNNT